MRARRTAISATGGGRIPAIARPAAPGAPAPAPAAPAPAAGSPLANLHTAVGANNRANALTAYRALGRRDRRSLRTDPILGDLVRVVAGNEGRDILRAVGPARAAWLRIGAAVYTGNATALTASSSA